MRGREKWLIIDYTNYRGERRERLIEPTGDMYFESSTWHPELQWVMLAFDCEEPGTKPKKFALKGIHSHRPV